MDSLSKQELISTITKQADQIKRYEARLRDVVAAYKGLAKEKEALEISLKALNRTENESETSKDDSVATLTLSLSTLAEEKSRLEEAFQADKKVTREKYENQLAALRDDNRKLVQQHLAEVNNLKAKIAYEIQERENERADHTAMLKELQMKLNSERITKEQFEEKYADSTESQATQGELEARVRELGASLAGARRRLARAQARAGDSPAALLRLRDQLALLEQSHALALREEQIKTNRAEESARKTCARQEERVALLEGKVAELSQTIGEYDARRRRDEQIILQLKESLNGRLIDRIHSRSVSEEPQPKSETDNDKLADSEYLQTLIDKIHILKKELIAENEKLGTPIDLPTIFKLEGYENMHVKCRDEYERLKEEFDLFKKLHSAPTRTDDVEMEIANLKSEVIVLKEKVEMYVMMLDDEKQEKADTVKYFEKKLKTEQELNKESSAEYKARIQSLETQLQAQRARGAAILREADNYVRARRASRDDCGLTEVSAPPHMLHYAHEVARKDLDISHLRREKHALEGQLRDCQREATIEKERFKEVIRTLKEEIDRLRRIQSREGANLEYLKNVVMAYLMSTDYEGRRHMLNAIAAVLHFTNSEKTAVLSIL